MKFSIYHFRKLVYAWIVKALVQVMYYTSSVTSEYSIIPLNVYFTAINFGGLKANRRKNTQNASSILISHIQYGWLFTLAGNSITFGFIFSHLNHLVSSHLVSYLTPLNINFYWNIGFLISIFFISQLSSGIILSTSYTSDVTFAYYSISSFIREVYSGWSFRYIHSQGASFIFAFYFVHIARAVVYSSCLFLPNTWFSGIWLFIFLILIAFIGYLLPWGMLSFWGATVITNLLSFIPLLIELICGGYFISTST